MILQLIFLPLVFSLINYLVRKNFTSWLTGIVQLYILILAFTMFRRTVDGSIVYTTGSDAILGITLIFDRSSGLFVLLTAFVCTVVILYAMTTETQHKLFVFLLFSMQTLMFTAFMSDDLFNIYVALEISLLICTMLMTYKREERRFYDGLLYLLSNFAGMLFFLMGVGYLYKIFGTVSITKLTELIPTATAKQLALPYAFIMTGVALKCGFFPVYTWLPKAHGTPGAPSVVSAILSSVFVKCAIFLFIRMRAMFHPVIDLDQVFLVIGIITGISGFLFALCQTNIKKILAYHTLSQLGLILLGISLDNKYGMTGALMHIVNHATFKSLLSLCAGVIVHDYDTTDITKIHGVLRKMPVIGIALTAGILGITGAPFFNGSISKYFIQNGATAQWVETFILIINTGTCLSFAKFICMLPGKEKREKVNIYTAVAVSILAIACFITGIFAPKAMEFLLGYSLSVSKSGYAHKALIWIITIVGSTLFYKKVMKKIPFFKVEHNFELSFSNINLLTVTFFGALLSLVYIICV